MLSRLEEVEDELDSRFRDEEPWWKITRDSWWWKLNVVGAVAVGAYLFGFRDPAWYDWVSSWRALFPLSVLVLIVAVPGIRRLLEGRSRSPTLAVWAIFATVFLAVAAVRAGGDAYHYQHSNCWTIQESGHPDRAGGLIEIIGCTPNGGTPITGGGWNPATESGSSRICDQIDTSSSGGTIWRCETINY